MNRKSKAATNAPARRLVCDSYGKVLRESPDPNAVTAMATRARCHREALAEGLPIASGVVEGACRHLVNDRMNLTGARWSLQGAEAALRLRALRCSDDFEDYWEFHERQEYERHHHAAHYADHLAPATTVPLTPSQPHGSRGTLKIVKK